MQLLNPVRFCPQCGGLLDLTERPGDARPRHGCTVCGRIQYRNSKPCAAVLITHDGRVLLVKRAIDPYRGCWDIPGGFLESDEHPELGALREAKEETGLVVQLTELFGIYMGRYNYEAEEVDSLNIYYLAEISGGTESPGDDATDLAWFAPEALPKVVAFDHAREVLEDWTQRMMTVEQT